MSNSEYYPPLNIHFSVEFYNQKDFGEDYMFQSVDGLKAQLVKDASQKQPHAEFDNIILKRAYRPNSKLVAWCMEAINNKILREETLTIKLLDANHKTISAWVIEKAIPIGWSVEELHAQDTKILIEVIELKYRFFRVLNSKGDDVAPKKKVTNNLLV